MAAAEREGELAIEDAYAEGYKAALLDTAPDRDYWKTLAERWQAEADRRNLSVFLSGGAAGMAATALVFFLITSSR